MAAKKKKKKTPAPKKKTTAKKKPAPKKKAAPKPKKRAAAKPKKKAAAKTKAKAKSKKVRREDRPGHYDPKYKKALLRERGQSTKEDERIGAFKVKQDDVAEELGEEVVGKATTGEDEGEDVANATYDEEVGGPFVVTTGGEEFADGTDESNPEDAEPEPFPRT